MAPDEKPPVCRRELTEGDRPTLPGQTGESEYVTRG